MTTTTTIDAAAAAAPPSAPMPFSTWDEYGCIQGEDQQQRQELEETNHVESLQPQEQLATTANNKDDSARETEIRTENHHLPAVSQGPENTLQKQQQQEHDSSPVSTADALATLLMMQQQQQQQSTATTKEQQPAEIDSTSLSGETTATKTTTVTAPIQNDEADPDENDDSPETSIQTPQNQTSDKGQEQDSTEAEAQTEAEQQQQQPEPTKKKPFDPSYARAELVWEGPPDAKELPNPAWKTWPKGWIKKIFERQSGRTKGDRDRYWFSPQGKKYRSVREMKRAFDENFAKSEEMALNNIINNSNSSNQPTDPPARRATTGSIPTMPFNWSNTRQPFPFIPTQQQHHQQQQHVPMRRATTGPVQMASPFTNVNGIRHSFQYIPTTLAPPSAPVPPPPYYPMTVAPPRTAQPTSWSWNKNVPLPTPNNANVAKSTPATNATDRISMTIHDGQKNTAALPTPVTNNVHAAKSTPGTNATTTANRIPMTIYDGRTTAAAVAKRPSIGKNFARMQQQHDRALACSTGNISGQDDKTRTAPSAGADRQPNTANNTPQVAKFRTQQTDAHKIVVNSEDIILSAPQKHVIGTHVGNKKYFQLLKRNVQAYKECSTPESKLDLCQSLVRSLPGGKKRFLYKSSDLKGWQVVSDKMVIRMTDIYLSKLGEKQKQNARTPKEAPEQGREQAFATESETPQQCNKAQEETPLVCNKQPEHSREDSCDSSALERLREPVAKDCPENVGSAEAEYMDNQQAIAVARGANSVLAKEDGARTLPPTSPVLKRTVTDTCSPVTVLPNGKKPRRESPTRELMAMQDPALEDTSQPPDTVPSRNPTTTVANVRPENVVGGSVDGRDAGSGGNNQQTQTAAHGGADSVSAVNEDGGRMPSPTSLVQSRRVSDTSPVTVSTSTREDQTSLHGVDEDTIRPPDSVPSSTPNKSDNSQESVEGPAAIEAFDSVPSSTPNKSDNSQESVEGPAAIEAFSKEERGQIQAVEDWLATSVFGRRRDLGSDKARSYAVELVNQGLHSVAMIQEFCCIEDVNEFDWMEANDKTYFVRHAGLINP